jgi:adenylate cyclase
MLDHHDQEIINTPVLNWLPKCEIDFANEMALVRETGDSRVMDTRYETAENGMKAFNISLSPLHDGNTQGVTIVLNDLSKQHENEEMLRVLRRYLSPEMVDNIHTIAALALGGERRETTCIFVDARPLSTFPVDLRPPEIMDMLNRHLTVAAECIHATGGVIDKYMGHEIMGLFNSQLNPQDDHAARAVEAALNIRDAFVILYQEMGINPDPHYYRIGIHTGVATLGNVGSEIRRDFTAIGDSINLSKRLEENAEASQIIISEDIREQITQHPGSLLLDNLLLEEREPIQVKGRQQRTRIYEVFRSR